MADQASQISGAFATHYYQQFDANRANLAPLFIAQSKMSFEGKIINGQEDILKKLIELPFKKVQHSVTTCDGHETVDNGLVVFVVGQLKTDDDPPHSFSEVFYLKNNGQSWIILNNIFRLSLHHG